jgi:uncharacterized protein (TIGR03083 family)
MDPADVPADDPADDVAYRHVRDNVTAWLGAHPGLASTPVPACPGWTVRHVLSHLVEVSWRVAKRWDRVTGELPAGTEDAEPAVLLELWRLTGELVDRILVEGQDQKARVLIMDTLTHEYDIRQAIGLPVPVDHPAMRGALGTLVLGFDRSVRARGLPPLLVRTHGGEWTVGDGTAETTLTAVRYDLYRSLAGRRTHAQIAGLGWSGPADPWFPAFEWGPFHPPATPVEHPLARQRAA